MLQELAGISLHNPVLHWELRGASHQYRLSTADVVWIARSLWREGAPQAAVGYTLLQRFASIYPKYSTLTRFIRAYVQPVNPAWFPNGYRHKRKLERLRKDGRHTEAKSEAARAKNRLVYARTPWEEIPEKYRELTERLLQGTLPNPVPQSVHFCASQAKPGSSASEAQSSAEKYADKKGIGKPIKIAGGFGRGMNWFFRSKGEAAKISLVSTKRIKDVMIASRRRPGEAVAIGILGLALMTAAKNRKQ